MAEPQRETMKILQEKQSPPLYPQSVKSSSPPTHKTYVPSIRSPDRAERTELSHMAPSEETRSEIAFFDVETTVPSRPGQGHAIVEFGAILVCPQKLVELHSYSTLVRPSDISLISSRSTRCNGITRDAVLSAPTFGEIADAVYDILHGRIWAGHNILRFDCARIREAFAEIGRPAPEPKGTIDSLALLTQRFGRRAGDMKMATLATYFGLGQQTHRSLDDVRMNLEVVKYCATVLFLESSLPDIFTANSWVSPNATTRSRRNGKLSPTSSSVNDITPVSGPKLEGDASFSSSINERVEENHPISSLVTGNTGELGDSTPSRTANPNSFDMSSLSDEMKTELIRLDSATEEEKSTCQSPYTGAPPPPTSEGSSGFAGFLEPEEISIPLLSASLIPYYRGTQRIRLLHNGVVFQLCSSGLRVRFGVKNFGNDAGRPKLSFVVDATPILCQILEACDAIAQKLSVESGSSSEWKPLVTRKNGFINSPTVRLHVPTVNADGLRYETEIYRKESSGAVEKLMFSQCNTEELNALISTGTFVDTYFSLDPYDYHENAGIRAVTKKLFICSKQSN